MNGSAVSLLVGAFIGTYLNNQKFKAQVDNGLRGIAGQGVDALNNIDKQGDKNVSNTNEANSTAENR